MNRIIILCVFFVSSLAFTQQKLTAEPNGMSPKNVIIEFPEKSAEEIYSGLLRWINITFENPGYVIKANIPNELLRIRGMWIVPAEYAGSKTTLQTGFTMHIDIKEHKIRYTIDDLQGNDGFDYLKAFKNDGSRRKFMGAENLLIAIEKHAEKFVIDMKSAVDKKEIW